MGRRENHAGEMSRANWMACVSGAANATSVEVPHRPLAFFDTRCFSGLTDSVVWRPDFDEAVSRCFRRTPNLPTEAAPQGIHQIDHIAWLYNMRDLCGLSIWSENRFMILVYVTGIEGSLFCSAFHN